MTRTLEIISPAGVVLDLTPGSASGIIAGRGVQLAGMPPIRTRTDLTPMRSGGVHRWSLHDPRELAIPVIINASNGANLEQLADSLAAHVDPVNGACTIRVGRHDGTFRRIVAVFKTGLALEEPTNREDVWESLLVFEAADPYFEADTGVSVSIPNESATSVDFFPFFPLVLSGADTYASVTLTNTGGVDVYPVWTIAGPAEKIILRNLTTGAIFDTTFTLPVGQTVTMDTGTATIATGAGVNLIATVSDLSTFWPLTAGDNEVRVEVAAAGAATTVNVAWTARWLTS